MKSPSIPSTGSQEEQDKLYRRLKWQVFIGSTLGYGLYYVCRLSLNVVKKPIVDSGLFTESQLGMIGSALFFTYAIGKFSNGFIADYSNIRRFMGTGLLISAIANLVMGFSAYFTVFIVCWGVNGWAQSMGAPSSVVGLSRWFTDKERGSYYGFWSTSHNIGEALTYIMTAVVVSYFGWRYGFMAASVAGLAGALLIFLLVHDSPGSKGLSGFATSGTTSPKSIGKEQLRVLTNPYIWLLALSSGFMYIARYAVNSWGPYYFQAAKGYSLTGANSLVAVSAVCGILGTASSGFVSDKFFGGRRNVPVLLFGLMNIAGLSGFLLGPQNWWMDTVSMVLFGLAIGALICYLGRVDGCGYCP